MLTLVSPGERRLHWMISAEVSALVDTRRTTGYTIRWGFFLALPGSEAIWLATPVQILKLVMNENRRGT